MVHTMLNLARARQRTVESVRRGVCVRVCLQNVVSKNGVAITILRPAMRRMARGVALQCRAHVHYGRPVRALAGNGSPVLPPEGERGTKALK